MKIELTIILCLAYSLLYAQPNCEVYKYEGNDLKYKACKTAEKRAGHYQFSRAYQEALDEALLIDSTFSWAYKFKSTAYLKSGDFITWKYLMDKAVYYSPEDHLGYRGWCRYQFFRDYKGAINDIELLDSLVNYDIGYSVNGDYHLQVAKALCYKGIGEKEKALKIMESHIKSGEAFLGLFDYFHLGVLYLDHGQYENAIEAFNQQIEENDLAENRYYLALCYKALSRMEDFMQNIILAKTKFLNDERMTDTYTERMDQIYLSDIKKEINIKN
jgi:tetratricopeptide (TPR) repeat protein